MLRVRQTRRRTAATVLVPALVASLFVAPMLGLGVASPAVAAPGDGTLNVTLAQQTGTPAFDADDAPGNDSSADNDIVRTNDTVAYTVSVRFEGEDQTNPTITFTLPQGEELVQLPPFCLTGSSVTPASLGAPTIPVTSTSYQSLPTQTVICAVENQNQGAALDYKFVSRVRPEVPNGTALTPVTASATSDQVTAPAVSAPVEHTVSAAADFDVSKRGTAVAENTGPYGQDPGVQECAFDTSRFCRTIYYPLTVDAPSGGKGITPLASPITLTDDLTPASFFGAAAWAQAVATAGSEAAAVAAYAPRLMACQDVGSPMWAGLPYSRSNPTNIDSVTNSGAIDCQQPGGTGTPVDITITGADTTGYHVPTRIPGTHAAIDADTGYVISYEIKLQIPVDAIRDLGVVGADGVTKTLPTENTYENVVMTDIAGNPNTGEVIANNNRTAVLSMRQNQGGAGEYFDKLFSSPIGKTNNTPAWPFSIQQGQIYEGPPGSGTVRDGNTVVLPGQPVLSNLRFTTDNGVPQSGTEFSRTYVGCDVWDDAQLGLTPGNYAGGLTNTRPSNGDAAWISYFQNGIDDKQPISDLRNLKIEYSTGPFGLGAGSDCTTGTWYDSPAAVPGAVLDAQGVYSGVNRVRVSYSSDYTGNGDRFVVNLAIGQTVRATAGAVGDTIGNWGSRKWVEGLTDMNGVLTAPKAYDTSSYVPETHASSWGDRLTIGGVTARINKFVKNPSTGEFTDTAVPQYTAGSQVDYRLNPTLSADVPAGVTAQAVVEDCLPLFQQFVSSVRANGDPITPVLVQSGAPADSELVCPAGQTYVKWDLGDLVVNSAIDPIIYTVDILETARNDVYTNTTLISSPQDPSPASVRDDEAQIQLVLPTGIKIDKSTTRPLVEINPEGVATARTLIWTVEFANIDSPTDVSNVDVIDVLPANGIGTTDYEGDLTLTSATVAAGTGITMLYTATAPAGLIADPDHASNGATGATVWCDSISGAVVSGNGTAADCPTAEADVTGLRFLRAGAFTPADEMRIDIVMTPTNNDGGDIYENTTSGRAQGVTQPVGPASREVRIIESSIGNFVWEDLNADGIQDAGEPGVAGFPVSLVGVDLDGNPVSHTTTTDADGKYLFPDLASGTYTATFDPNALATNTTFTTQNAGADDALDSDGDATTGQTAEFALAPDSGDPNWDQGLIIDRNVEITMDKKLVEQTDLDENNKAIVTYDIVVANAGTAEGTYDLDDQLQFGGDIVVDAVTVSNTDPGDIEIDPDFDGIENRTLVLGQPIAGGETHTYRVVVETTVATTVTQEQRDCVLTDSELGTGFLNEAQLTVDGETVTDVACGEVPPPPVTPPTAPPVATPPAGLASTGAPVALGAIGVAAMLALAGAVLIAVRRRRNAMAETK